MLKTVVRNPWVQAIALLLGALFLGGLAYLLSPVLVPLLFALIVAYILNPVVDFFEARRVPRSVTVSALAVGGLVLLLSIPLLLLPRIITEAQQLAEAARTVAAEEEVRPGLSGMVEGALEALPLEEIVRRLGWVPEDQVDFDAREVLAERIGTYVETYATQLLQSYGQQLASAGHVAGKGVARLVASLGRQVVAFLVFLGNFALFAFMAGYLLRDFNKVLSAARDLIPPRWRPGVTSIASKIDVQVHSFLRGQMVVCLGLGTMYAIGLVACGVPFAIPIAVFGALANFVPYLGIVLTMGPAVLLTWLRHGLDWHVAGAIATFIIAQTVESTFLTPKVLGDQIGLNPVWVILAIMVFGHAFGFAGLLIAVPTAAVLKVLAEEGVANYKRSPVFRETSGEEASPEPDSDTES